MTASRTIFLKHSFPPDTSPPARLPGAAPRSCYLRTPPPPPSPPRPSSPASLPVARRLLPVPSRPLLYPGSNSCLLNVPAFAKPCLVPLRGKRCPPPPVPITPCTLQSSEGVLTVKYAGLPLHPRVFCDRQVHFAPLFSELRTPALCITYTQFVFMGMNELMNQQMIHKRPTSLKLLPRNSSLPFTSQVRWPEDGPSMILYTQ